MIKSVIPSKVGEKSPTFFVFKSVPRLMPETVVFCTMKETEFVVKTANLREMSWIYGYSRIIIDV